MPNRRSKSVIVYRALTIALAIEFALGLTLAPNGAATAAPVESAHGGTGISSLEAVEMVTVGRVTATAHYSSIYRSTGSLEIWIDLHSDAAGVYGLDTYHDFSYHLVNQNGQDIPTVDLSHMSHLPVEGGPTAVASPSWPYGMSLAKIYGHLSPGNYALTIRVEPRDGRFPPIALPMHITVSDSKGYIGSPTDP